MNLTHFKARAEQEFGSIEKFAEQLGLSKIAIYKWLRSNYVPRHRLPQVAEAFQLDEAQTEELLGISPIQILMRKIGNTRSNESKIARLRKLAFTFLELETSHSFSNESRLGSEPARSKSSAVLRLRSMLDLKGNEPATVAKITPKMRLHDVSLFYFPFQRAGYPDSDIRNREVAFTARRNSQVLIFIDTSRTFDEVNFDILHELSHIVADHTGSKHDPSEESFCNSVAQELIYPAALISSSDDVAAFTDAKTLSWSRSIDLLRKFRYLFDWSPMGLALALIDNKLIKKSSHEHRRLMKLHSLFRARTIDDLFFSNFDPSNYGALSQFFGDEIERNKDVYRAFIDIKDALVRDRISETTVADLLNLEIGDTIALVRSWVPKSSSKYKSDSKV